MTKDLLVVILLAAGGADLRSQTILYDREGSGVVDRGEVVLPGHLDRGSARILARDFLNRYGEAHQVLSLLIGEDDREIRASCWHRAGVIPSGGPGRMAELKKLKADIDKLGPPKHPIARVISIGGNALLTYREGDSISDEVLRGADPTRFRINGVNFELLHMALSTGTAAVAEDVRDNLALYFRTKPRVSLSTTLAAFRQLASTVKINNLDLLVRSDAWFLEYDDYPIYPAFVLGLRPLNVNEYELSSYVTCGSSAKHHLNCSGRNFEP